MYQFCNINLALESEYEMHAIISVHHQATKIFCYISVYTVVQYAVCIALCLYSPQ